MINVLSQKITSYTSQIFNESPNGYSFVLKIFDAFSYMRARALDFSSTYIRPLAVYTINHPIQVFTFTTAALGASILNHLNIQQEWKRTTSDVGGRNRSWNSMGSNGQKDQLKRAYNSYERGMYTYSFPDDVEIKKRYPGFHNPRPEDPSINITVGFDKNNTEFKVSNDTISGNVIIGDKKYFHKQEVKDFVDYTQKLLGADAKTSILLVENTRDFMEGKYLRPPSFVE